MSVFNFEKEMVYGKKHVNILDYNNKNYDFRPFARECFNLENLSKVHSIGPSYNVFKEFGVDTETWYHDTFYTYLKSEKGEKMKKLYDNLITDVVLPYMGLDRALVQQFPTFRVQLPNNIAVAKKHTDNLLGHPIGEVNFTYSFTNMYDTNTIWIEMMPRFNKYISMNLKENKLMSFNANLCMHYNKINETKNTRMSMDFRVLPLNYYDIDKALSSRSTKQKFIDGGYYKLMEIKNNLSL